jgi:hypothetical protein
MSIAMVLGASCQTIMASHLHFCVGKFGSYDGIVEKRKVTWKVRLLGQAHGIIPPACWRSFWVGQDAECPASCSTPLPCHINKHTSQITRSG